MQDSERIFIPLSPSDSLFGYPFHFAGSLLIGSVSTVVIGKPDRVSPVPNSAIATFRSPYTGGSFSAVTSGSWRLLPLSHVPTRLSSLYIPFGLSITMRQDSSPDLQLFHALYEAVAMALQKSAGPCFRQSIRCHPAGKT